MTYKTIAIVDFSHMLRVNYHARANDSGPNDAGQSTLQQLSDVRSGVEHVIVALDSPPYDRVKLYPEYKAGRERDDAYIQICRWTKERLVADGYSIAASPGAEADDVIATLAATLDCGDIRIIGSDKDSLQCVRERDQSAVRVFSPLPRGDYEIRDAEWVNKKYGVWPEQMALFQAICGDKADNIPGIAGIGDKGAAKLINEFGTIEGMRIAAVKAFEASQLQGAKPLAAFWTKFLAGAPRLEEWLALTTLRTDVPLDVPALLVKQTPKPLVAESSLDDADDWSAELEEEKQLMTDPDEIISKPGKLTDKPGVPFPEPTVRDSDDPREIKVEYVTEVGTPVPKGYSGLEQTAAAAGATMATQASAASATEAPKPAPKAPDTTPAATATIAGGRAATGDVESIVVDRPDPPSWALALQPSTAKEAMAIAKVLINSRFVSNYGTPEGVFAVISLGRELGLGMMQALQGFHIVKDRPFASAHTLHALAESDPNCEWLVCTESTDERATWETSHRKAGKLKPFTYTRDEATKAGCYTGGNKHNWQTRERQMLRKTAMANAVRIWYPRAVAGLMIQEEMSDE